MSDENREPTGQEILQDALRRTREHQERWRREHPDEETDEAQASASSAGEPREDADARIVRWEDEMRRYADENGGLVPTGLSGLFDARRRQVRLTGARADTTEGGNPPAPSAAPSDTEKLLNGLIEECRSLLRDVAFRSACLTPDADERIRFLTAAQNLATTGANVGKVVARLRPRNASAIEEHRYRMVYEHLQTPPSPQGDVP